MCTPRLIYLQFPLACVLALKMSMVAYTTTFPRRLLNDGFPVKDKVVAMLN
jgi:hypothetical protein